jgi:hypothetical protein
MEMVELYVQDSKHKRLIALNQMILLQPNTAGNGLNFVTKGK